MDIPVRLIIERGPDRGTSVNDVHTFSEDSMVSLYGSCNTAFLFCPCRSLDLTGPLLLGGVPNLPENFPVTHREFIGCMKDLYIDSRKIDLASYIANNGTSAGRACFCGYMFFSHLKMAIGVK